MTTCIRIRMTNTQMYVINHLLQLHLFHSKSHVIMKHLQSSFVNLRFLRLLHDHVFRRLLAAVGPTIGRREIAELQSGALQAQTTDTLANTSEGGWKQIPYPTMGRTVKNLPF